MQEDSEENVFVLIHGLVNLGGEVVTTQHDTTLFGGLVSSSTSFLTALLVSATLASFLWDLRKKYNML